MSKALVLLSGGLDSATTLLQAVRDGFEASAASFHYGQRHSVELERARVLAERYCKRHFILRLDPVLFQNTALVEGGPAVPEAREIDDSIPITYVPARNILFLSHALALAESHEFDDIFIGVNALDYSGYPDCRPEFIEAFERMALLGMKRGVEGRPVRIRAPLMRLGKAEIVRLGVGLGLDFSLTSSCYAPGPSGKPCGVCDSCQLRARGFQEAGVRDPLIDPD